ncbi:MULTISPECIES: HTH-type transcriptional regulator [Tenebrionibacter/Tenebrionicola group]|jgi:putative transcriptional regulator|uniref:HTH-type transcriptional regulator n=2 Tax=Tenebrionibacter/Tenebrionicola group TaxID=2969848 RepID=A0A8K0V784_9ENTR|nr:MULTISPECIES: HTH-type transcriptional regulator [Tenebrionibacter/Tenebrionicola group]MBK4716638.1 HTH-type transcriptional regulator [Tenebrionibacter intestinalis]MBV4414501.1 HTH-type transcriptional regulator [Tenebrionicola larvae]MBV5097312.1 HTH-type transcriptional regulator [Tenebrionicola larvae]
MEVNDPVSELLNNLELIVFKKTERTVGHTHPDAFNEFMALRDSTGLEESEFARAMGVSVTTVREWSARRIRPSGAELKLLRLIQANPRLSNQLLE